MWPSPSSRPLRCIIRSCFALLNCCAQSQCPCEDQVKEAECYGLNWRKQLERARQTMCLVSFGRVARCYVSVCIETLYSDLCSIACLQSNFISLTVGLSSSKALFRVTPTAPPRKVEFTLNCIRFPLRRSESTTPLDINQSKLDCLRSEVATGSATVSNFGSNPEKPCDARYSSTLWRMMAPGFGSTKG